MRALLVVLVLVLSRGAAGAAPARPAELVAVVSVDSTSLAGLRAYADAVSPGTGAMIDPARLLSMMGATITGLDLKKPAHFLIAHISGAPTFAFVAKVADAKAITGNSWLKHKVAGGWAILGAGNAVDALSAYAFATFPSTPAPRAPAITIYPAKFGELLRLVGTMTSSKTDEGFKALEKLLVDVEQIDLRVDANADLATLDVTVTPRAGSRLAQLIKAQRPSDFSLLGKLPAMQTAMFAAGTIAAGPYRDELRELGQNMYATGNKDKGVLDALNAIIGTGTGDYALAGSLERKRGMTIAQLFSLGDAKAADTAIAALTKAIGKGQRVVGAKGPAETWSAEMFKSHDGIALRGFRRKFDAPTTPEERDRVALHGPSGREDNVLGIADAVGFQASGPDGGIEGARVIDALRGRGARLTLTRTATLLVDSARAHRDSFILAVDAGPWAAEAGVANTDEATFAMSAGAVDGNLHMRLFAPAVSTTNALALRRAHDALKAAASP